MFLDLLRAKLGKVYEDAKKDTNHVITLLNFQHCTNVSLRRASQSDFVQHRSHGSTECVSQPLMDCLTLSSLYMILLDMWRWRDVWRSQHGSCIGTSNVNKQKRSDSYSGEQGHTSTSCAKCELNMQSLRDELNWWCRSPIHSSFSSLSMHLSFDKKM